MISGSSWHQEALGNWVALPSSVSVLVGPRAGSGSLSYSQAQLSPVWSLVTSEDNWPLVGDKLLFWCLDGCGMRSVHVNLAGTTPQGQGMTGDEGGFEE